MLCKSTCKSSKSNLDRSRKNSAFLYVIRGFYTVFIILPDGVYEKHRQIFSQVFDYTMIVCMSYIMINDCYLVYNSFQEFPFGIIISAMTGNICSMGTRIALMRKSKEIVSAIHQIFSIHQIPDNKKVNVRLSVAFCVWWSIPSLMYFRALNILLSDTGIEFIQRNVLLGSYRPEMWATCFAVFIKIIIGQQVYALPGCCAILCYYICSILTRAIVQAGRNLKTKRELREILRDYLEISEKLTKCVNKVETALSFILLLLYCYLMSCIFIVITVMVRRWSTKVQNDLIFNITMLVLSFLAFLSLSIQAGDVHVASVKLRKAVYELCIELPCPVERHDESVRFLLLTMADAFVLKTRITIWGFFSLNRSFILQTTGAMVSYGIIIAQLGYG